MSSINPPLSVSLKVRVTADDDAALNVLAGKKRQKKAQLARTAIVEFLSREDMALPAAAKPTARKQRVQAIAEETRQEIAATPAGGEGSK